MFTLSITEDGGDKQTITADGPEVSIGRVQGNDVVLPKGSVSKRHAKLVYKDGEILAIDLKSTNGTLVNGHKIQGPTEVGTTDIIKCGDFMIVIESVDRRAPQAPTVDGGPTLQGLQSLSSAGRSNSPSTAPSPIIPMVGAGGSETRPIPRSTTSAPPAPAPTGTSRGNTPRSTSRSAPPPPPPAATGRGSTARREGTAETLPPGGLTSEIVEARSRQASSRATRAQTPTPSPAPTTGQAPARVASAPSTVPFARQRVVDAPTVKLARPKKDTAQAVSVIDDELTEAYQTVIKAFVESVGVDNFPMAYPASENAAQTYQARLTELVNELPDTSILEAAQRHRLVQLATWEATSLGPIEAYLEDSTIEEIQVSTNGFVTLKKDGVRRPAAIHFGAQQTAGRAALRLAHSAGFSESGFGRVELPDGTRIDVLLPPYSRSGAAMTIRKPVTEVTSIDSLLSDGSMDEAMAATLRAALACGAGVLVTARERSDASIVARAFCNDAGSERFTVAVDDGLAPPLDAPNSVSLEAELGAVQRARKLGPDVLLLDPLPSEELPDLVLHDSGRAHATVAVTVARTPEGALPRIDLLTAAGLQVEPSVGREMVRAYFDLLVHVARTTTGQLFIQRVMDVSPHGTTLLFEGSLMGGAPSFDGPRSAPGLADLFLSQEALGADLALPYPSASLAG